MDYRRSTFVLSYVITLVLAYYNENNEIFLINRYFTAYVQFLICVVCKSRPISAKYYFSEPILFKLQVLLKTVTQEFHFFSKEKQVFSQDIFSSFAMVLMCASAKFISFHYKPPRPSVNI